jgi:hypothetical protein
MGAKKIGGGVDDFFENFKNYRPKKQNFRRLQGFPSVLGTSLILIAHELLI